MEVKIFQVGCGDAIAVRFKGEDGLFHNIFIDSGLKGKNYLRTIKKEINEAVLAKGEKIDLWILTHFDNDHINGCLAFFQDKGFEHSEIVQSFWFNFSSNQPFIADDSNEIGLKEGVKLRDKILDLAIPFNESICNENEVFNLFGAKIIILSPDKDGLDALKEFWVAEEENYSENISSSSDYDFTIENLSALEDKKEKSNDIPNGSSIAFLFEYKDKKILFLGDTHSSVIVNSIKALNTKRGIAENTQLKVDYVKLPHHGSKYNFSKDFLAMIDCPNFIISTNGASYGLPNKVVLAKILTHHRDFSQKINFIFNYDNTYLRSIFKVDEVAEQKYNFQCLFPEPTQNAFVISF